MRILQLPTNWLISLGIGTQYAIVCPPTLSGPSGDTENLTTVSSIYTTHAASPTNDKLVYFYIYTKIQV